MKNITFELSNVHQHGSSFYNYLALRKQFFVDTLKWQIPHNADVEMDQYDNPMARYSLVLDDDGRVLAGSRAMSTAATWGGAHLHAKGCDDGKIVVYSIEFAGRSDRQPEGLGMHAIGHFARG